MIVQAAPEYHFYWLVERTSCAVSNRFHAIEAVNKNGTVLGMIGYDLWTKNSVQMHIALDSPVALKALIRPASEYPFLQAGRDIVHATIPENNLKSRALVMKAGYREVYRVKDGWDKGVDMILYEMRKHECRWIRHELRLVANG